MGHLEDIAYGIVDQPALNATTQQIVLFGRDGMVERYDWTLQEGPQSGKPFAFDDLQQIKEAFIGAHSVDLLFAPINVGGGHIWDITIHIEPFSVTSIIVSFLMKQKLSLAHHHILPFILGLILALFLAREWVRGGGWTGENTLLYFLCVFLVLSSLLAFS